jgi:hypothetical protein
MKSAGLSPPMVFLGMLAASLKARPFTLAGAFTERSKAAAMPSTPLRFGRGDRCDSAKRNRRA